MNPRAALAVLLVTLAAGQAASFPQFRATLSSYRASGPTVTPQLAASVVATEAIAGAGLVDSEWIHWPASALALAVAVGWTVLATVALRARRRVDNCGCFGAYFPQRLRPSVLAQDAAFVGLAGWVALRCPWP